MFDGPENADESPAHYGTDIHLLAYLQECRLSIHWDRAQSRVLVIPRPPHDDPETRFAFEVHKEMLRELLPGVCFGCGVWHIKRIEAFWEPHPHLCARCVGVAIVDFERHGWPEVEIEAMP